MSVQFDPTPVRPRRPRSDSLVIVAAAVLLGFVTLSVVKPWQAPLPAPIATPAESPSEAPAQQPPSRARGPAPVAYGTGATTVDWSFLRGLVHPRRAAGIEAIVQVARAARAAPGDTYPSMGGIASRTEIWTPIPPSAIATTDSAQRSRSHPVDIPTGGTTILAIGVTMPADRVPLDVRFWSIGPDRPPARLGVYDTPATDVGGIRLFSAGDVADPTAGWAPGEYLAEMLTPSTIERVAFEIPGPGGVLTSDALPRDTLPNATIPPTAAELALLTKNLPSGEVFTVDRVPSAISWAALPSGAEDERVAWLAMLGRGSIASAARGGGARADDSVAIATVLQPTAIGLKLPATATLLAGRLLRLAPTLEVLSTTAAAAERSTTELLPGVVLFAAATGRIWPAGVYRLDATWEIGTNAAGRTVRHASWVLDLARWARSEPSAEAAAPPRGSSTGSSSSARASGSRRSAVASLPR